MTSNVDCVRILIQNPVDLSDLLLFRCAFREGLRSYTDMDIIAIFTRAVQLVIHILAAPHVNSCFDHSRYQILDLAAAVQLEYHAVLMSGIYAAFDIRNQHLTNGIE